MSPHNTTAQGERPAPPSSPDTNAGFGFNPADFFFQDLAPEPDWMHDIPFPGEVQDEKVVPISRGKGGAGKPKKQHASLADAAVAELNDRYAFIEEIGSKTAVLDTKATSPDGRLIDETVVFKRTANQVVPVYAGDNKDGEAQYKYKTKGTVWFGAPERREYCTVKFLPGESDTGNVYNFWRGWGVSLEGPVGSWRMFRAHVFYNLAGGSQEFYDYIMDWCAALLQRPQEKCGTALAFLGEQGVGKSFFGEELGMLMGAHFIPTSDIEYVLGSFNSGLEDKLLLQMEEAVWGGDKQRQGKLKDRITAPTATINRKYAPSYNAATFDHYIFTSNEEWAVPVEKGDRRFAVFHVSPRLKEDARWFIRARKELRRNDNSGLRTWMKFLLERKVDWRRLKKPPRTDARTQQMVRGFIGLDAWWYNILQDGTLPGIPNAQGFIHGRQIYASFLRTAKDTGLTHKATENLVSDYLKAKCPGFEKKKQPLTTMSGKITNPRHIKLPPLADCREHFAKLMAVDSTVWEDPNEEWEVPPSRDVSDWDN